MQAQFAVYWMRIACPAALIAALTAGTFAWSIERYELAAINAFLVGVNAMLTWIQWRVLKI